MMTIVWWSLIALCMFFGFLGCFINKIPSPLAVVIAVLIAKFGVGIKLNWEQIVLVIVMAILCGVVSKLITKFAKNNFYEYSKRASRGTKIGFVIGLCILPSVDASSLTGVMILWLVIDLIVLPVVFAFLLELTTRKGILATLKSAFSAMVVYIADTLTKIVLLAYAIHIIISSLGWFNRWVLKGILPFYI